jgi:hypothetical protein
VHLPRIELQHHQELARPPLSSWWRKTAVLLYGSSEESCILCNTMSWRSVLLAGTAEEAALIDQTARFILCYLSPFLFLILYAVVPSPYGKLITPTWQKILGPSLPAPLAWLLFELPNLAWAGVILTRHVVSTSLDGTSLSPSNYLLVGFFVVHYIRRALWYPLQMSPGAKAVPLGVVINALVYTSLNG